MHILKVSVVVPIFLFLASLCSAQNYIRFDKVDADNDIIPHIRKRPVATSPTQQTFLPAKQQIPQVQINSKAQAKSEDKQGLKSSESSTGPPIITIGGEKQRNRGGPQPRQAQGSSNTKETIAVAPDTSFNYQQYNAIGGGHGQYSPSPGYGSPGYSAGWNSGTGCSTCSTYDYSYRQRCCTFGHTVCCTVNSVFRPSQYSSGYNTGGGYGGTHGNFGSGGYNQQYKHQDRWGWNNREKPGLCYRPTWNSGNHGWNSYNNNNNHNAGYYFQRADVDRDFSTDGGYSGGGGYQNYNNHGVGGYSQGHSGGYGSVGILGGNGLGGYSQGHSGGYGSVGILGGGQHNQHQHWSSCRRDYECPGNQKCCYGTCSTPSFIG